MVVFIRFTILALASAVVTGCSGAGTLSNSNTDSIPRLAPTLTDPVVQVESGGFDIPAPLGLPHQATAASSSKDGDQYEAGWPNQLVTPSGTGSLAFFPRYDDAAPDFSDISFAIYSLAIPETADYYTITFDWQGTTNNYSNLWLGLANFSNNGWDWQQDTGSNVISFSTESNVNGSDLVYLAVVCLGETRWELNQLTISSAEFGVQSVTPLFANPDSPTTFSAIVVGGTPGNNSYLWDFGGGATPDSSTAESPVVTAGASGMYDCSLTFTSLLGTGQFDFTLVVQNVPVADIQADPTTCDPVTPVSFDATGSTDSDGFVVRYDWDWDSDGSYEVEDGNSITGHTYTTLGQVTATVRVWDDIGASDTASIDIQVVPLQVENLSATDGTYTDRVEITWDQVADADGYKLQYMNGDGGVPVDWADLYTVSGGTTTSFDHTGISPVGKECESDTTYIYKTKATLGVNESINWSNTDTGYILGFVPAGLVVLPEVCGSDVSEIQLFPPDPKVRRNGELTYSILTGEPVYADEDAYFDVLKDNTAPATEFPIEYDAPTTTIYPVIVVVPGIDPDVITGPDDPDHVVGIVISTRQGNKLDIDIATIPRPGGPAEPNTQFAFRVFTKAGTTFGDGTFECSFFPINPEDPVALDWSVNLWDRVEGTVDDLGPEFHDAAGGILDGNTVETATPDVLWFEFSGGWVFGGLINNPVQIMVDEVPPGDSMLIDMRVEIAGLAIDGHYLGFHPAVLSDFFHPFENPGGLLRNGGVYQLTPFDPLASGPSSPFERLMTVTGSPY